MPMALLRAYARALPKLQAEEASSMASVTALGSGTMKPEDAKALSEQLRKQAGAQRRVKRATNKEIRELFGGPQPMPVKGKP